MTDKSLSHRYFQFFSLLCSIISGEELHKLAGSVPPSFVYISTYINLYLYLDFSCIPFLVNSVLICSKV